MTPNTPIIFRMNTTTLAPVFCTVPDGVLDCLTRTMLSRNLRESSRNLNHSDRAGYQRDKKICIAPATLSELQKEQNDSRIKYGGRGAKGWFQYSKDTRS